MAKRFHDTCIWRQDWYLELPTKYLLLWNYIKDDCNHAGIWKPNKKQFEAVIGEKVDLAESLTYINNGKNRIEVLASGRWFLPDYICFQYGAVLNLNNRVHLSIMKELKTNDIDVSMVRGLKEVIEGSNRPKQDLTHSLKDKDIDKDKSFKSVSLTNNTKIPREKASNVLATMDKYEKDWVEEQDGEEAK